MGVFISRLQVTGILVSIECGWRVTEQEPTDFYSILLKCGHCGCMPWAYCMSSRTSMTYRPLNRRRPLSVPSPPPQFHNRLPGNKKRCVLITQGCPPPFLPPIKSPWHQTYTASERNTHTAFCPCSCERFCQKIRGRLPNRATPSIWANRRESDRFQNKSDSKTAPQKVASALGQPPPLPKMVHPTQEQSVPPWVVWGGTSVFRANACVHEPEGIVETITLNSAMGKEWQFLYASLV